MARYLNDLDATTSTNSTDILLVEQEGIDKKITINNLIPTSWEEGNDITLYDQSTDQDREIEFASDANILWDESEDQFNINKGLKVDGPIIDKNGLEVTAMKTQTLIKNFTMNGTAFGLTFSSNVRGILHTVDSSRDHGWGISSIAGNVVTIYYRGSEDYHDFAVTAILE